MARENNRRLYMSNWRSKLYVSCPRTISSLDGRQWRICYVTLGVLPFESHPLCLALASRYRIVELLVHLE